MVQRKNAKFITLLSAVIIIALSFVQTNHIGLHAGCTLFQRLSYPWIHVSVIHALTNVWCLISIMFLYNLSLKRLLLAYIVAVTFPVSLLPVSQQSVNTVGLSGVCFFLMGSIILSVQRKAYFAAWVLAYLMIGFFIPNVNAVIHLYACAMGVLMAILCKHIR